MPLFTLTFTFLEFISVCLTTAFTLLTVVDGTAFAYAIAVMLMEREEFAIGYQACSL